MVLSLPVPNFSRSFTSPRPDATAPAPQSSRRDSSSSPSSSRSLWRSPDTNKSTQATSSTNTHSVTLSEALRNNPFGNTSRSRSRSIHATISEAEQQQKERDDLNAALETLARIFPDIQIEVFRELLVRFDGQSRLQVCVEQLLRHKRNWVRGRWNVLKGGGGEEGAANSAVYGDYDSLVLPVERFRSDEYKSAVRTTLFREFSGLNRSTIEGVMAEMNFSYSRARPVLRDLARRTWRATFNSFLPSFKRKKDRESHPLMNWQRQVNGELVPKLKETSSSELDSELHETLLLPFLKQKREEQETADFQFASDLNEKEARDVDAFYECECCFSDVTFEQIVTCSANAHIICHNCVQRTTHEALFGQGWGKSVDMEHATLKCLAPVSVGACDGCLHPQIVRQAIMLETSGSETYRKFEDRLASETLLKSQIKLIRCPFCSYAEADPVSNSSALGIDWHVRRGAGIIPTILMTLFLLDLVPLLLIPLLILLLIHPSSILAIFNNSIRNLCIKLRPKRFTCANPTCRRVSCMTCQKSWHDPHVCHEPLLLDLRATVEAARTAAVKRTCPQCGLSFVKSSGCNKLTCVCGYSMCYLCRKALGAPIKQSQAAPVARRRLQELNVNIVNGAVEEEVGAGNAPEEDEFEEEEGYKHFCEHFRINPGSHCSECTKCDLYQTEDEEAVARRAGDKAEREWLLRQGNNAPGSSLPTMGLLHINQDLSAGAEGNNSTHRSSSLWDLQLSTPGRRWSYWFRDVWSDDRWKLEGQAMVDWIVEMIIVIDEL
ncbi:hypothetical protein N7495_006984 [Penicillium taxi]|uniref:uncharacterized protein n=1 Tax=Penicillium taxi TaxID=168475 RepID=UPI00254598D1|nr:uncharacterized protein N7495_006984 [Penicillium taxi]KAJ5895293.1 hypothetical protein N7495_006984 [Penicillium taxi]